MATAKKTTTRKPTTPKKTASAKTKPGAKKAPKAPKGTTDKDAFGSRTGTKAAAVNAVLGSTPKRMRQIMEEAGVDQTFYNHLNRLVAEGHIVKTAEGYACRSTK